MGKFKLRRGYDIKLAGAADKTVTKLDDPNRVAVLPNEFRGLKARLNVKVGDSVKIGTPLFEDKSMPDIKVVSPVSGKVLEINRGERRALVEVVIENNHKNEKEIIDDFKKGESKKLDADKIKHSLLKGGMWPHIIQRPFSRIANPEHAPRDIFISGMDTAQLAADPNFIMEGMEEYFQTGLDMLSKLTSGKVHLSLSLKKDNNAEALKNAAGVEKHYFSGPHPAGNIGIQIHHINHIKRGEIVWTIKPYAVALIGKFFTEGCFQSERIVAVAGSSLKTRKYFKTIAGTPVSALIPESEVIDDEVRYISGNILSGRKITAAGYVSYYDNLISVIPEGSRKRKLLGYFRPGFKTPSYSNTYLSKFLGMARKDYVLDTQIHGGKRAFVATGDYERVLPMDIYPVYLAKSILADDIEEMEGLGILELDEEDVALCSYICLSKTNFGQLLRTGLNFIEKEG
ncbi:MAG: Na(+)-translocating NADH-quinone reductase subunit A [Calditrichaceae bacterium]